MKENHLNAFKFEKKKQLFIELNIGEIQVNILKSIKDCDLVSD